MTASCCVTSMKAVSATLGIEPSVNVADVARGRGIRTISAFFDRDLADDIVAEHGRADAVLAANVMCHIPDLPGVAAGVQHLLKPDGVFIFEDPYLGDMIAKTVVRSDLRRTCLHLFGDFREPGLRRAWSRTRRCRAANHSRRFDALHAGAQGQPGNLAARC